MITACVPQGSGLGFLLFLILLHVNNMVYSLRSCDGKKCGSNYLDITSFILFLGGKNIFNYVYE